MAFLMYLTIITLLAWIHTAKSSSYPEHFEADIIPEGTIVGPGILQGYGRKLGAYDDGLDIGYSRGLGGFGRRYSNIFGRNIGYGKNIGERLFLNSGPGYGSDIEGGYVGGTDGHGGASYVGSAGQSDGYSFGSKAENGHQGQSAVESAHDFSGEQGNKKQEQHDAGHYGNEGSILQSHQLGEGYLGASNFQQADKKEGQQKEAAAHKKGYSTKGFQNYHHKDETSKSTTFYDESNDEGDHYNYQGHNEAFGDNGRASYKNSKEDGHSQSAEHGHKGEYNVGQGSDAAHGTADSVAKSLVKGDDERFATSQDFNDFGNHHGLKSHQLYGNHYKNGYHAIG